jgi:CRP-like cAMP-binding protein
MSSTIHNQRLRHFIPLSDLSTDNYNGLVNKITIEKFPAGTKLFNKGEWDNFSYYLLSGEVEIIDASGEKSVLNSESDKCHFPLEHNQPRKKTVLSKSDIEYFKVDNNLLDVLITWDQNKNYIVNEIGNDINSSEVDENDWMTQLLHLDIFHKIPSANIQRMFQRLETVPVKKDEVIITQGEQGDFYYIIHAGSCRVIRNAKETGYKDIRIANLQAGSSFGEEALVSNVPRNATIIMNEDGMLIRLAKNDFNELLKVPVIKSVGFNTAKSMVANGAMWLDVRFMSEHKNNNIPGSLNIPLYLLRLNADKLLMNQKYIIYCDTGSRSASATYILSERGYDAYLLDGGLAQSQENNAA